MCGILWDQNTGHLNYGAIHIMDKYYISAIHMAVNIGETGDINIVRSLSHYQT